MWTTIVVNRRRRRRCHPAPLHAGYPAAQVFLASDGCFLQNKSRALWILNKETVRLSRCFPPERALEEAHTRKHHLEQAIVIAHAFVQLLAEVQHLDLGRVRPSRLEHVDHHSFDFLLETIKKKFVGADVYIDVELVLDQPGA